MSPVFSYSRVKNCSANQADIFCLSDHHFVSYDILYYDTLHYMIFCIVRYIVLTCREDTQIMLIYPSPSIAIITLTPSKRSLLKFITA